MSNNQGLTTNHSHGLRPIQMSLQPDTIAKVKFIRDWLGCDNNTDAVVRGIKLLYNILAEMEEGARIELHRKNGDVRELEFK